jgi:hypothetical protein
LYRTLLADTHIGPQGAAFLVSHKLQWWLRRRRWKYRGV